MADQLTHPSAEMSSATDGCSSGGNISADRIFDLEMQLAAANAEIQKANVAQSRAERQVAALKNTVAFLRQQKGGGCSAATMGRTGDVDGNISPVRSPTKNTPMTAAALSSARKRKCVAAEEDEAERADIARLRSETSELKRELSTLRQQLDSKSQGYFDARKEAAVMREERDVANEAKAKIKAEANNLMDKMQKLEKTVKEKEQQVIENEKVVSELRDKAGKQSNVGLLRLKDNEIHGLKMSLAEAKGKSNAGLIKSKEEEIQSLKKRLAGVKNESSDTVIKLKDVEIRSLKKKLAEAESSSESNTRVLKLKDGQILSLKNCLTEAKTKAETNAQMRNQLKTAEEALRREKCEKKELNEDIRDLKAEISELSAQEKRSYNFPRITADMNVAPLKGEAKERGLSAGDANAMKKADLLHFLEVGTIHLVEVKRIMKVEKNPEAEAARLAAEQSQKAEKAARQKEVRERKAAEKKHNDALLTKKTSAHSCSLGPTGSLLMNGLTRSRMKSLRCDIGHCRYLSPEKRKAPEWSCIKCDYDVCTFCLDIAVLPQGNQQKRLAAIAEEQQKRLAAIAEEKSRALREKWAWTREFPTTITNPTTPAKAKRRFAVMACRGSADTIQVSEYEHESDISKQFDSAFETVDDANHRAQYVFYCQNRYGEAIEVFGENRRIQKEIDEDGTIVLSTGSEWSDGWKVFVASYSEYEERLKNQKKELLRYKKAMEKKEAEDRKEQQEQRRKKEEKINAIRKVLGAPARIKNPPKSNRDRANGKGFTVLKTSKSSRRGESRWVEFDSSFKTKADANTRARYLCYVEDHPWGDDGLDAEDNDLSDCASIPGVVDEVVDGMVDIEYYNEDYGDTRTFTVLPDDAFRFVDAEYDRKAHNQSLPKKTKLEKLPAKVRKPPAASTNSLKKKKYTVWTSCGYGYDGFHSYEGPPAKEFFASFDTLEEANGAAEYKFFVGNPWGFKPDDNCSDFDNTFGDFSKASKMNCVEYSVEPDDSECWTVAVAPSSAFHCLEDAAASASPDKEMTTGDYYGGYF